MHKAIAILTTLFAIYATLGFGRRLPSAEKTYPSTSLVYTPSAVKPATTADQGGNTKRN